MESTVLPINYGADVVHLKSSQFTGRHSWPPHQVALAFEGQKYATSDAPQAEVQKLVTHRGESPRYYVSPGTFEYEVTVFDVKGHEIRLRLADVLAIAAD